MYGSRKNLLKPRMMMLHQMLVLPFYYSIVTLYQKNVILSTLPQPEISYPSCQLIQVDLSLKSLGDHLSFVIVPLCLMSIFGCSDFQTPYFSGSLLPGSKLLPNPFSSISFIL